MSLLGTTYSKISGSLGIVLLENSLLDPIYSIPDELEHTSVINGNRNYLRPNDYSEINVTVFLTKYANPNDKLAEINKYLGEGAYLYPHSDGAPLHDEDNNPVEMYLSDVEPFYLNNTILYDAVNLTFKSSAYTYIMATDESLLGYGYRYATLYGTRL